MFPHMAPRPFIGSEPNLAGLVTFLTSSPTPNLKLIDIKLCLWRRVEVSYFSSTNMAKPCHVILHETFQLTKPSSAIFAIFRLTVPVSYLILHNVTQFLKTYYIISLTDRNFTHYTNELRNQVPKLLR